MGNGYDLARSLESALDSLDTEAIEVCRTINNRTTDFESSIRALLSAASLDEKMTLVKKEERLTPHTPDAKIITIPTIEVKPEYKKISMEETGIGFEHALVVTHTQREYLDKVNGYKTRLRQIRDEQEQAYTDLLNTTQIATMTCTEKPDAAVIYIALPGKDKLMRTYILFSQKEGATEALERLEDTTEPNMPELDGLTLAQTAQESPQDVRAYLARSPSERIQIEDLIEHIVDTIWEQYNQSNFSCANSSDEEPDAKGGVNYERHLVGDRWVWAIRPAETDCQKN